MRTEKQQKLYEYKKAWAKANAEKMRAYRQKYEDANKEKIEEYRNSEKFKKRAIERASIYAKANPDRRKEIEIKWRKNNPHKLCEAVMRRNARKLQATPSWADFQKIQCLYSVASMLTKYGNEKWEVDHIVPLRSKVVCGLHTYENLRVITSKENRAKWNKFEP